MIPAIIAAIAALVTSVVTSVSSMRNQSEANKTNLKMTELNNYSNVALWREQTEYNDPSNQMQRLASAGLNPNLVYGSGSVVGQAGSAPNMVAPNINPLPGLNLGNPVSDLPHAIMEYQQFKLNEKNLDSNISVRNSQMQKVEQEIALLKTKMLSEVFNQANMASRTARNNFELGKAQELRQTSMDFQRAQLRRMEYSADLQQKLNDTELIKQGIMKSSELRNREMHPNNMLDKFWQAQLKKLQFNLDKRFLNGSYKNDPWWLKRLMEVNSFNSAPFPSSENRSIRSYFMDKNNY